MCTKTDCHFHLRKAKPRLQWSNLMWQLSPRFVVLALSTGWLPAWYGLCDELWPCRKWGFHRLKMQNFAVPCVTGVLYVESFYAMQNTRQVWVSYPMLTSCACAKSDQPNWCISNLLPALVQEGNPQRLDRAYKRKSSQFTHAFHHTDYIKFLMFTSYTGYCNDRNTLNMHHTWSQNVTTCTVTYAIISPIRPSPSS